jgi:histidine ammonia-lyase
VRDAIDFCWTSLLREINSATDNPLVFASTGSVLSGGNFHGAPIAYAGDLLAIVITDLGAISERRIERLVNPDLSGLPPFLARVEGLESGFMLAHVTAASLVSENKVLAHPASVDTIPTSANTEDHVSMSTYATRKALVATENVEKVLAIELLVSVEALEERRPLRSGPVLEEKIAAFRRVVPRRTGDCDLSGPISDAVGLIRNHFAR